MLLRPELFQVGHTVHTISTELRQGNLLRVRRGVYRDPEELTPEQAHEVLIRGTLAQTRGPYVVSHESAAVLHGLPVDRRRLDQVHLLRQGEQTHSAGRGPVVRHRARSVEVTVVDGLPVTTLASTVVDLTRRVPFRDGVALADVALQRGVSREELFSLVRSQPRRHHNRRVLSVAEFADSRSESPGESHTRARIFETGLEVPDLQAVFVDDEGEMRTDFWWRERGLVGEFDGEIKYGRELRDGLSLEEVIRRERRREVRLHQLGQESIRFSWHDLRTVAAVRAIVAQGFALARRWR